MHSLSSPGFACYHLLCRMSSFSLIMIMYVSSLPVISARIPAQWTLSSLSTTNWRSRPVLDIHPIRRFLVYIAINPRPDVCINSIDLWSRALSMSPLYSGDISLSSSLFRWSVGRTIWPKPRLDVSILYFRTFASLFLISKWRGLFPDDPFLL